MTAPRDKRPLIYFGILSATLMLGGLGSLGAFLLLHFYYPTASANTAATAFILAVNGGLAWLLAVFSMLSGWRLFQSAPKAEPWAKVTWILMLGFTLWTLFVDAMSGWSAGGIIEVIVWSILEILIAVYLRQRLRTPQLDRPT